MRNRINPPVVVPWLSRHQWDQFCEAFEGDPRPTETYDEWLRMNQAALDTAERHGSLRFRRVDVDVDEFLEWCEALGHVVDVPSLMRFATALAYVQDPPDERPARAGAGARRAGPSSQGRTFHIAGALGSPITVKPLDEDPGAPRGRRRGGSGSVH